MRLSARELLARQRNDRSTLELNGWEDFYRLLVSGRAPEKRKMNPTQVALWTSEARARAYKGPAGCAKTSTVVVDVMAHALLEPGSKLFIARHDYNDLMDTTAGRAEEVLSRLPAGTLLDRDKSPPMKWWLRPIAIKGADGQVDETPSLITFMGLKEYKGSYEFNGGAVDEAAEVEDRKIVLGLLSRLRHMKGTRFLDLAFNPPSKDHWLYTACTGLDEHEEKVAEPVFTLFEPHPNENAENLPPGYQEELAASLPEDMRQSYVDGAWGSTFPGDPVIPQFRANVHTKAIIPFGHRTLYRFWDFGFRRPYCCWAQITKSGALHVMAEILGQNQEVDSFAGDVLRKTAELFHEFTAVVDYGDPAVKQQKDTGSALAILKGMGITMRSTYTPFDLSLRTLRMRFERMVEGAPAILIAQQCRVLVNALKGGYHLKPDGVTPVKDEYYDHPVDALRYGVWNLWGVTASLSATNLVTNIAYWEATRE